VKIPEDHFLIEGFFRSLQWDKAKKTEAFKHKRGLRDAIREYLHIECGVPENETEATEIEKAVGRVQFAIRSRWGKKAARTRARKKKLKERELIRRAKTAIEKFITLKSPVLFLDLPVQTRKPSRNVA
jgi:hypothetical protein